MIQIDMEMPKSCDACKIGRFDFEYDNSFCPFVGDVTQMVDERPQKCPLKELNSEIEKSNSKIVPDYRDGWRLRGDAE